METAHAAAADKVPIGEKFLLGFLHVHTLAPQEFDRFVSSGLYYRSLNTVFF